MAKAKECKWNGLSIIDNRANPKIIARTKGFKATYLRKQYKELVDCDRDIIINTDEEYNQVKQTIININVV